VVEVLTDLVTDQETAIHDLLELWFPATEKIEAVLPPVSRTLAWRHCHASQSSGGISKRAMRSIELRGPSID